MTLYSTQMAGGIYGLSGEDLDIRLYVPASEPGQAPISTAVGIMGVGLTAYSGMAL